MMFCVYRLLVVIVTASRTGFRSMSQTSRGCVTLCCRLFVVVQSLRLVVLFLKNVSKFTGVCYSLP